MKRLLLGLITTSLITGCETEENIIIEENNTINSDITENPLLGSWTWIKFTDNEGVFTPEECGLLDSISFSESEITTLEYDSNGNGDCELINKKTELYSIEGNIISYIGIDENGTYTYSETYEVVDDILYLTYEDEVVEYQYTTDSFNDNETPDITTDLDLVGDWTLTAYTDSDGSYNLTECDLLEQLNFDLSQVNFTTYETTESNDCEMGYETTESYSIRGNTITYYGNDDEGDYSYNETYVIRNEKLYLTYTEVDNNEIYVEVSEYTRE